MYLLFIYLFVYLIILFIQAELCRIKAEEESQANQTEKLSSIVNQAEDQMQKLRADYAKVNLLILCKSLELITPK
jgi:hypothetical protein